ncbi:hypothetical protein MXD81_63725 [Microbacteriaceae bacterium K1510]|nr:hypothetical protein [Microbacteriaceae bacterium K1510]
MSPEPYSASEVVSADPSLLSDADAERGDWAERVIAAVATVVGVLIVAAIAVVIGVA